MNEPVSDPPKANTSSDQNTMSLKCRLGTIVCKVKWFAAPKRCNAIPPITITITAGIHMAIAPTLCNHLPTFSPTTFTRVARLKVSSEKAM